MGDDGKGISTVPYSALHVIEIESQTRYIA